MYMSKHINAVSKKVKKPNPYINFYVKIVLYLFFYILYTTTNKAEQVKDFH